jgi:hypothetical protein
VRSHQTLSVRLDRQEDSLPPEAVGRPLPWVASDTVVRIRPPRREDRHPRVLDPAPPEARLASQRTAFPATPASLREQAVPESQTRLDRAFAPGESERRKLLDQ